MRILLSICIAIFLSVSFAYGQDSTEVSIDKSTPPPAPVPVPKIKDSAVKTAAKNFKEGSEIEGEPNLDWGQVDLEHLKMTSYKKDTSANVILLLNYSKVDRAYYNGQFGVFYDYHFRIKIIDKSKYQGGEVELMSDSRDQIVNVKGQTINWVDGAIERVKVKEVLTDEQSGSRTLYRFSFPEIMDGSILEYKYRIFNPNPVLIVSKYFQSSLPVVWSEYRFFQMNELDYKKVPLGGCKFDYKRTEEVEANDVHDGGTEFRWVMKDVPGIPEESYSATLDNSLARMAIQLHSFKFDGRKEYVFKDWENYTSSYYKDEDAMGQVFISKQTKKVMKGMKSTLSGATSKKERMILTYNYIRDNMDWTGDHEMYISIDLKTSYKYKRGTSADINFLLIGALRKQGIKANPVLLSTRGHGRLYKKYPLTKQFNHVIAHVEVDGETYLLDATYKDIPYNLLAFPNLNYDGLLITSNDNEWIDIKGVRATKKVQANLDLTEDGVMTGTFEYSRDAYRGFEVRRDIEEQGKEDYEDDYFSTFTDSKVTNLTFENENETDKPIIERMDFTCETIAEVGGDLIYFNLLMGLGFSESMFREPIRYAPIEMPYPLVDDYSFKIKIPEGYSTEELPESMDIALPDNEMSFKYTIEEKDGYLIYNAYLRINKVFYEVEEYQKIKDFMDKVVEKQTSQIVLKKNP